MDYGFDALSTQMQSTRSFVLPESYNIVLGILISGKEFFAMIVCFFFPYSVIVSSLCNHSFIPFL